MDELKLLRDFFHAWEELDKLPKKNPADLAYKTARQIVNECAEKVRQFRNPKPRPEVNEFRVMQQQVASIAPKDGFKTPSYFDTQHKR